MTITTTQRPPALNPEQFQRMFDGTPMLAALATPSGKLLARCVPLDGIFPSEAVPATKAESLHELLHWATEQQCLERLKNLIASCASGNQIREEISFYQSNGETGVLDLHLTPVLSDEKVHQIICIGIEQSALAETRSELKTSNRRLETVSRRLTEAGRRRDEFLATLAHELRNPLAPVLTGVELIKQLAGSSATIDNAIDVIERQTHQMSLLIDDLMDASRVSQGNFELRKHVVSLDEIIRQAMETIRPSLDDAQHTVSLRLPDARIWVTADPLRISQVLTNLLKNAAKFTHKSGKIDIDLRETVDGYLIRVADNGRGFAPETIDSVFDMYTQLDKHPANGEVGLGVGLALSRYLVERHGGTLDVVSDGLNLGSVFRVILPLSLRASEKDAVAGPVPNRWITNERRSDETSRLLAAVTPPDVGNSRQSVNDKTNEREAAKDSSVPKVLIVDDNDDAAYILSELLEHLGVETVVAHTGERALAQFGCFRPDMVLLDIGLPDMNGHAVARTIRQTSDWGKRVNLVALTGLGGPDDKEKSRAAGFNDHRVKPISIAELGPMVQQLKRLKWG